MKIGPIWINTPLFMQERYDPTTQQCVHLTYSSCRVRCTSQHNSPTDQCPTLSLMI